MRTFTSLLPIAALALCATAHADITTLNDNFDAETVGGVYNSFANFDVVEGSVDVVGPGFFDILPGNGNYVDLDGGTGNGGTLTTKQAFAPGAYRLSFDLAGSQRGDSNDVTVTFGTYSQTFTLASSDPFATRTADITLGTSSRLTFANAGGDNLGALLDRVTVQAVPEPTSMAALALGGLVALRRRRSR